jgi:hypothetical protein
MSEESKEDSVENRCKVVAETLCEMAKIEERKNMSSPIN